jgi:hypothetical protein
MRDKKEIYIMKSYETGKCGGYFNQTFFHLLSQTRENFQSAIISMQNALYVSTQRRGISGTRRYKNSSGLHMWHCWANTVTIRPKQIQLLFTATYGWSNLAAFSTSKRQPSGVYATRRSAQRKAAVGKSEGQQKRERK